MSEWNRYRFVTSAEDFRPVKAPLPGPWWCSGFDSDARAYIIAWVPSKTQLKQYWPEAEQITVQYNAGPPRFTDRFLRPDWYVGVGIDTTARAALEEKP